MLGIMVIKIMENIAILIYSLKGGGAERVVSLLSQELSKKYNLYLIVFDSDDMAYSYGGTLVDLNIKSHYNFFIKIINVIRRVYYTRKVKKKYNIKSSISFLGSANIINILSRREDKIIISIRSHLSKNERNVFTNISRLITKILYNKADNIIAVSKGVAKDLIKEFELDEKLISCIYNPIDVKRVQELSQEQVFEETVFIENQFTLLNMGRLTNAKGQWHLIRALSYVKKEIPNIKLLILGQGELENYFKNLVKSLGLQDNVIFLGYNKNPFKYIRNSDIFVFSSLYEGLGNVLLEAMACGTPIISSDCRSGPREILAPKTEIEYETRDIEYAEFGVLVPVCDGVKYDHSYTLTMEERVLAESIIDLIKNEELRKEYSNRGKRWVENFNIDKIAKKWERILS